MSGIRANNATFFSPSDRKLSSSVAVRAARLCKSNFSSLAARVICIDFKVFPKTAKSKRSVSIPDFLCSELKEYVQGMRLDQRIFPYIKNDLRNFLRKICSVTGVKVIRIHDIRHSHASLLIELGLSPKIIADRLGHEKIETTLNIYSHLYPNKQEEIADKLQALF